MPLSRHSTFRRWIIATALLLLASSSAVFAQENAASVPLEIPPGAEAGPDFDVATATEAYVNILSEEQRDQSNRYADGEHWLQLWGFLYAMGIAWLLLGTGLSAKMRNTAEKVTRFKPVHTFMYYAQYTVLVALLLFPLTVYEDFFREHQYNMATHTFGSWSGDVIKNLIIDILITGILVVLVYGAIRKAREKWWIWATGISFAMTVFVFTIAPVYLSPLFNKYEPLEDGPLRDRIVQMAEANGIPSDDIYWFDASAQTTQISANVSGMFGTTRISLNDNLLNRTSMEEIEAVMAHEMGHYVLNHGMESIIYISVLLGAGFAFVAWSFNKVNSRWGSGWGIRDIGDTAGLPLLFALLTLFFFLATPVFNGIVRQGETEADNYALNVSRQPDGFARVAMRLSEYRKVSPGPVERFIFNHHPSGRYRVTMSMIWKAHNMETDAESNE